MKRLAGRMWALRCMLVVGLSSCTSFSTTQRAEVLACGRGRFGASAEAIEIESNELAAPIPMLELAYRRGIGAEMDVGAKVWPVGISVDLKRQILRTADAAASVAVALGASGFSTGDVSTSGVDLSVPLLFGLDVLAHSQVILGSRLVARYGTVGMLGEGSTRMSGLSFLPGFLLAADLAPSATFHLMPEINVHFNLGGASLLMPADILVVQAAFGVYWG